MTAAHAAIVLAAGGSTRLGRPKQLLRRDGESLVARVVRLAAETRPCRLVVMLGAYHDAVAAELAPSRHTLELCEVADWRDGLSASLRAMTEALARRLDSIDRFAADVAHELKNPLTSLKSAVETAARVPDPAVREKLMAIVLDDVQRLDRLITDISGASRLDAELSRADAETLDVAALLEGLCDALAAVAKEGQAKPVYDGPAGGGLFVSGVADMARMRRSGRTAARASSARARPTSVGRLRSCTSSNTTRPQPSSDGSCCSRRVSTPSVTTSMRVCGPMWRSSRVW